MTPVSLKTFHTDYAKMSNRVTYLLGAKAPSLDCDPSEIHEIDCSGFSRYILYKSTSPHVTMPDGSANQHDWAAQQGFHKLARYTDVQYATGDPKRLFIAFMAPSGGHGHVWFVLAGRTYESHGSGGVSSRAWSTPILVGGASGTYELPAVSG